MVSDQELLAESLRADDDPAKLVLALVEAANTAGGKDNISIVVLKVVA
jgi:serine/threonine protein phosphatase PrpC